MRCGCQMAYWGWERGEKSHWWGEDRMGKIGKMRERWEIGDARCEM